MTGAVSRYPDLFQFLGWLHQDFDLDHPDADAAVDDAIRSTSVNGLSLVRAQLAEAIAEIHDETQAEDFVRQLCDYYPPGDGRTFLGWLGALQERLAAAHP